MLLKKAHILYTNLHTYREKCGLGHMSISGYRLKEAVIHDTLHSATYIDDHQTATTLGKNIFALKDHERLGRSQLVFKQFSIIITTVHNM